MTFLTRIKCLNYTSIDYRRNLKIKTKYKWTDKPDRHIKWIEFGAFQFHFFLLTLHIPYCTITDINWIEMGSIFFSDEVRGYLCWIYVFFFYFSFWMNPYTLFMREEMLRTYVWEFFFYNLYRLAPALIIRLFGYKRMSSVRVKLKMKREKKRILISIVFKENWGL